MRKRASLYMRRRWMRRIEKAQQDREFVKDFLLCLSFAELCQLNPIHFNKLTAVNSNIVAEVFEELTSGFSRNFPSLYEAMAVN